MITTRRFSSIAHSGTHDGLKAQVIHVAEQHPGYAMLVVLGALLVLYVLIRSKLGRRVHKDVQRVFTTTQRLAGFRRAGNQCEHKPLLLPRCRSAPTHGDHIYPHSRGGATTMSNLQAMCARCNLKKSAKVPSAAYIWRLERRRRRYFPPGEPVEVVWKQAVRS